MEGSLSRNDAIEEGPRLYPPPVGRGEISPKPNFVHCAPQPGGAVLPLPRRGERAGERGRFMERFLRNQISRIAPLNRAERFSLPPRRGGEGAVHGEIPPKPNFAR